MNWDDDEKWDNCAPGAFGVFGGDYSDENEKTCLSEEGMDLFVFLGLLNDWL